MANRGRPPGLVNIVNPQTVVTMAGMTQVDYSMRQFVNDCSGDAVRCREWLAMHGLLKNEMMCANCNVPCRITSCTRSTDGVQWRCSSCNFTKSIRFQSFFERSHLSLQTLVELIYHWSLQHSETEIKDDLNIDWHSVVNWCNFIREICTDWLHSHQQPIGGLDAAGNPKVSF